MSLVKLHLTMVGTLLLIISFSTLLFTIVLSLVGSLSIVTLLVFVVGFSLLQWLVAPYLIGALYGVRDVAEGEMPKLHAMVKSICRRTGLAVPRLMLANIGLPNAFAYGSPLTGNRIAVTKGLLGSLEDEEVEAVLGHELGHLKHRDVQLMMFVSVLPAIFYYLAYSFMLSGWYGGGRDRDRSGAALIGVLAFLGYFILNLMVLGLSRIREYYADQHSVQNVDDGKRKLSEALAKISVASGRYSTHSTHGHHVYGFKSVFISDPDTSKFESQQISYGTSDQAMVQGILERRTTGFDRFVELFSTHPNIVKRLKALSAA